MHIGFDISQTGANKAGCGYFAHAMIEALLQVAPRHRYSLYPSFGDFYFDVNMQAASPYAGRHVAYGPRHRTLEEARALWTGPSLDAALGQPDIVHSNNFWCPAGLHSARLVYTLHDLSFVKNPAWTTEANRAACFAGVACAAQRADWIVAVSNASREHYLRVFPAFPAERIRVIHEASRFRDWTSPGTRPASLADVAPGGFWLSVGTLEPRKNQRRIAEAYARYLRDGGEAIPLVFAGGHGWLMEDFHAHLHALGVDAKVIFTGYVADDELVWLYRNCRAHIYVSLFEGFGLPVLEGMGLGAATIASNTTSIPEVAGEAALLVDPLDGAALAGAMARIAQDPAERARLSNAGKARAARFDWRTSAASLAALYEDAMAHPKRASTLWPIETSLETGSGSRRGGWHERFVRFLRGR